MSHVVGQEEMFEVPATRRFIVPVGHRNWWGIDPSSARIALAGIYHDGTRSVEEHPFPKLEGPQRLSMIAGTARELAFERASVRPPGVVCIEQPSGQNPNLELVYAVAAIMVGTYDGVLAATGSPARFVSHPPMWWKKRSIGRGDISKPTKKKLGRPPVPEDYQLLRWAWQTGMAEGIKSWDCADAWGIVAAIRRDIALDER